MGQRRNGGNNREVFCTYCKKYRHQVGNCIALKAELKRRGYKIAGGTMDLTMETMDNKMDKDQTEVDFKTKEDFRIEVEEIDFKIGMEEGQDFKTGLIV